MRRSCAAPTSRPACWRRSTTNTSARVRRTSATSGGGWPTACSGGPRVRTSGTPTARPAVDRRRRPRPVGRATLRPELVAGIALAGGAPTGHAAIVARGLGIPLVLGLGRRRSRSTPALDGVGRGRRGHTGHLIVAPTADDLSIAWPVRSTRRRRSRLLRWRRRRAGRGRRANVGSVLEAEAAAARRCRRGSGSSGPSSCSSAGPLRPASSRAARHLRRGSATASRVGRSSSGRSTSAATSPRRGTRIAPEANPALGVRGVRLGLDATGAARRPASGAPRGGRWRPTPDHAADGGHGRGGRRRPRARLGQPHRRRACGRAGRRRRPARGHDRGASPRR